LRVLVSKGRRWGRGISAVQVKEEEIIVVGKELLAVIFRLYHVQVVQQPVLFTCFFSSW
jgi:hypothetical protein